MMTTARHWLSYGTDPLPTGDVLRDQDPIQAQRIADLFNWPANDTPWRMVKQAN